MERKSPKTLIFDTETNGLPKYKGFNRYYEPFLTKYYNNARVIEIAYVIYDGYKEGLIRSFLIKPSDFKIENSHIHGITQEKAMKDGMNIVEALKIMKGDMKSVDRIVAHNIMFDLNVLYSECFRQNENELVKLMKTKKHICTMYVGKKYMKIKKFPKLTKLYKFLFSETFDQEHRALSDVIACKDCYFEMIKRMRNSKT